MKRHAGFVVMFCAVLITACDQHVQQERKERTSTGPTKKEVLPQTEKKLSVDSLIVPGKQVGKVRTGLSTEELTGVIGQPDSSDAAMGKAWLTWWGKQEKGPVSELNVFTAYRNDRMTSKTVQLVRTTSPRFRTVDGIGVHSALTAIAQAFPSLRYTAHYKNGETGELMSLYEDAEEGIAFEVRVEQGRKKCKAVLIFEKDRGLFPAYLTYLNANRWGKERD